MSMLSPYVATTATDATIYARRNYGYALTLATELRRPPGGESDRPNWKKSSTPGELAELPPTNDTTAPTTQQHTIALTNRGTHLRHRHGLLLLDGDPARCSVCACR